MGYILTIAVCIASFFYTFPLINETVETVAAPYSWFAKTALHRLVALVVLAVQIYLIFSPVWLYTWSKGKLRRVKPL